MSGSAFRPASSRDPRVIGMHEGRSQPQTSGVIEIGLRDVYDEVRRVVEGHGELAAKLDTVASLHSLRFDTVNRELAAQGNALSEHEKRLRAVEIRPVVTPTAMWVALGVLATLASAGIAIVALFVK